MELQRESSKYEDFYAKLHDTNFDVAQLVNNYQDNSDFGISLLENCNPGKIKKSQSTLWEGKT